MWKNKLWRHWYLIILILILSLVVYELGSSSYKMKKLFERRDLETASKVIIIGAGAAGIAAAARLIDNGFTDVIVLEAEDRIGGRINTVDFGPYQVDLGAQWVHGQEGNVAYELADPLGLLDSNNGSSFDQIKLSFYDSQGNRLNDSITDKLARFSLDYAGGGNLESRAYGKFSSLGEYLKKKFDEKLKETVETDMTKSFLHMFEMVAIAGDAADSWNDLPISDEDDYTDLPGDQLVNWKKRGYSTILDVLMKVYPDSSEQEIPVLHRTILNSEVTNIDWSNDTDEAITVMTTEDELFKADHVIVTVSLGVLKEQHESLFTPPLPQHLVKIIKGLEFGKVAKIILEFKDPFWDFDEHKLHILSQIWDSEERTAREQDPEKFWTLGSYGFMTVEHKPTLLMLWINGNYAKSMETLPETTVLEHVVEMLHKFFGKTYNVSQPIRMMRSKWYSNPHFRGTYSYRSRRTVEENVAAGNFDKFTPDGEDDRLKIIFAGEATSDERYGTVDGAIGSGWHAADKLIQYYNKSQ